jgi:preflagellin peptidase FlaK
MISTAVYVYLNFNTLDTGTNIIICASIFAFFILGTFNLMGGADAWALIFISIFTIPFANTFVSPDGIAMASYTNAIIFVLIFYPIYNWCTSTGTDAPLYYRIFAHRSYGYSEYGFTVTKDFGYIIDNEVFYYDFPEFLHMYMHPNKLFYTKKLMDEPEKYKDIIRHYESNEMANKEVWMLNAIPFVAFIFAGFLTMIFVGDLFHILLGMIS